MIMRSKHCRIAPGDGNSNNRSHQSLCRERLALDAQWFTHITRNSCVCIVLGIREQANHSVDNELLLQGSLEKLGVGATTCNLTVNIGRKKIVQVFLYHIVI